MAFRRRIFGELPHLARDLAIDYRATADHLNYVQANRRLRHFRDRLVLADLNLEWDRDRTERFCEDRAKRCEVISQQRTPDEAYQRCCGVTATYEISPPSTEHGIEPALLRLADRDWWLRQVGKLKAAAIEGVARDLGRVTRATGVYASDRTFRRRRVQIQNARWVLERTSATNDLGQTYSLQELVDLSTSNPANRRTEFMVRIRGFEEAANQLGHVGRFVTLTCPGHMHQWSSSGRRNPRFDRSSPKDANDYLCRLWAQMRAKLDRAGLRVYGFRVAEPHHDARHPTGTCCCSCIQRTPRRSS